MINAHIFTGLCKTKSPDTKIKIVLKNDEIFFRLKNVVYKGMNYGEVLYIMDRVVLNDYLINMNEVQCIKFEFDAELKRKISEPQNSIMENKKEDKISMEI